MDNLYSVSLDETLHADIDSKFAKPLGKTVGEVTRFMMRSCVEVFSTDDIRALFQDAPFGFAAEVTTNPTN